MRNWCSRTSCMLASLTYQRLPGGGPHTEHGHAFHFQHIDWQLFGVRCTSATSPIYSLPLPLPLATDLVGVEPVLKCADSGRALPVLPLARACTGRAYIRPGSCGGFPAGCVA